MKPDNIGLLIINEDGAKLTVQLFDFGLCREIPEANPPEDKAFHMSSVGTRRYMSPEVFLGHFYNVKADVYSWSIVFHLLITLQRPYEMYDSKMHKLLVCQRAVRPTIYKEWPRPIQQLLSMGWSNQYKERPSMKDICRKIEGLLNEIQLQKKKQQQQHVGCKSTCDETITISTTTSANATCDPSSCVVDNNLNENNVAWDMQSSSSHDQDCFFTPTTVEKSISNLVESFSRFCSGYSDKNDYAIRENSQCMSLLPQASNSTAKSLLRTLERHIIAEAAGGQLIMMKDHKHPYYRDKLRRSSDHVHGQHLRSSFL